MSDGVREAAGTGVRRGSRQCSLSDGVLSQWVFLLPFRHDFSQFGSAGYGRCLANLCSAWYSWGVWLGLLLGVRMLSVM